MTTAENAAALLERMIADHKTIRDGHYAEIAHNYAVQVVRELEQLRARLEQDRKELIENIGKAFELFNDHNAMSYGNAEILQRKIVGLVQGEKKKE